VCVRERERECERESARERVRERARARERDRRAWVRASADVYFRACAQTSVYEREFTV
jgi:hypothetical protein